MKTTSSFLMTISLVLMFPAWSGCREGHWMAPAKEAGRKNPMIADKASIGRGGKLYKTYCASCHGETGRGDGPAGAGLTTQPADLKMMAMHHPDGDLAWKIANGRDAMPGWTSTLTEDQIWDLVNFIKKGI